MELDETNYRESPEYRSAFKKVKALKGFYVHLTVYLAVNVLLFYVYTLDEDLMAGIQDISNYVTAFFWGLGLLAHAASVFLPNMILGRDWEERKIKQLIEKENRRTWE